MAKSKKTNKKKRLIFLIIAFSVLVVLGTFAGWWYFMKDDSKNTASDIVDNSADIVMEARSLSAQGDVAAGVKLYDDKVELATDERVKKQLVLGKINYLIQQEQFKEAVAAAKEAVKTYGEDMAAHAALARAYEANGQTEEAINEYKSALSLYDDTQMTGRVDYEVYFSSKIKELEG